MKTIVFPLWLRVRLVDLDLVMNLCRSGAKLGLKKRHIFLFLFLVMLSLGWRNRAEGIEPYSFSKGFSEGLGHVIVDGKYGYVDKHGTIVIKPRFEWAG